MRTLARPIFAIMIALAVFVGGLSLSPAPLGTSWVSVAEAQAEKKKRRSLFSILFGRKDVRKKKVRKRTIKRSTRRKKTVRKKVRKKAAAAAAVEAVEKREDAQTVLVVGDFFADGLASGLQIGFAESKNIRVIEKANGLSGFVRTDVVNWPERLPELVEEIKPDHIVVQLGSNDRQLIREGGKKLKTGSPEWKKAYEQRVKSLGKVLQDTGLPFTWVGLPPVRFNTMNVDYLVFNEFYRAAASEAGGTFIDVWDGFADANGAYVRSGPDINGQIVLLRNKDGISLTKAGKRRLSFFIEALLSRALSGESGPIAGAAASVASEIPAGEAYNPVATGRTVVFSLADPNVDGSSELVGAAATEPVFVKQVGPQLPPVAIRRVSQNAAANRATDYTWPPVAQELTQPAADAEKPRLQ